MAGREGVRSNLTVVKRVPLSLLLVACISAGLNGTGPAEASTQWRDVQLKIVPGGSAFAAAYDLATGRIISLTRDPYQDRQVLAAYVPGRSRPVWQRAFAPGLDRWVHGSSYAGALVVAPKHHRAYVGGGYHDGTGSGPFKSAGFLYAFDTRTGEKVWSHTDRPSPGMGGIYNHLAKGPRGSVIAVQRHLVDTAHSSSGSYATEVARFDRRGRPVWRWIDNRRGFASDLAITRKGLVVLLGETYVNGYARDYRLALNSKNGRLSWRRVTSDPWEYFDTIAWSNQERTLYVGGGQGTDQGSHATVSAVNPSNGRIRWRRQIEAPAQLPGELSYFASSEIVATRRGPCLTGKWEGRRAVTYQPILPDDGFITCYSVTGKQRWIDKSAGAQGRVLEVAGHRLLWMGRQEVSRTPTGGNSEEVVRFATRSVADGSVRHSSQRSSTTHAWIPSRPLAAFSKKGKLHFVVATAPTYDANGDETTPAGLLDRVLQ